jgi:hypothetical protein
LAKGIAVCRPVFLVDVAAVDDVEVFEDRVTAAGHRQDAKQLGRGISGTGDVPSADHVGAASRAQSGHLGRRRVLPMASPKSWRSCFSSGPVVSDGQLAAEKRREAVQRAHPQRAQPVRHAADQRDQ